MTMLKLAPASLLTAASALTNSLSLGKVVDRVPTRHPSYVRSRTDRHFRLI